MSAIKKILLITRPITPPWDEASKNFAFYLAKNLRENLEINLMTKGILPDLPSNIRQHPIYTTAKIADFNLEQKLRSLYFQFRNKEKFDIFHYFFTPTKLNSCLIKSILKSKKGKTIQTVAALREDLWSDEDIKNLMFSDLIITYSDYAKEKLNKLGFENVKRVYPGIDIQEYRKTEKDPALTKEKNISENDFVINFTGEYTRLGAIDIVIDSFIEITKKIPEARLALAVRIKNDKDATKKKEVMAKLKEAGVLEKVSFFDEGNYKMSPVYNLCDISLFPVSDMNGKFDIPLAVVEAMASEKPVILSNLPILKELTDSDNSVIIPKGNQEALIEAVLELYHSPAKREQIGKAARKFVEERFDIKNVASTYQKIYETL
jgi:glycosyltransferase involved in cell wall biosynthesis